MTTILDIPIRSIDANPYQPRQVEDAEHIQKIAVSIAREGLIQTPAGRVWVDGQPAGADLYDYSDWPAVLDEQPGARVQLAFGHSRLAAYRLLAGLQEQLEQHEPIPFEDDTLLAQAVTAADQALERGARFDRMPVNLRPLTDEELFRLAVGENLARKDLTPIETAQAMITYRDVFHKTSGEIGTLFGYSDSAVRNKFRLLDLPEELRGPLSGLAEMALREILSLLALPEEMRSAAERLWPEECRPSEILREAAGGATYERLHGLINRVVTQYAEKFAPTWKSTDVFDGAGIVGVCKGCAFHLKRDNTEYCTNKTCYWAKVRAARLVYLRQASLLSGIPVLEDTEKNYWETSNFHTSDGGLLETARAAGCPNLRLMYHDSASPEDGSLKEQGFPKAVIICAKRKGFCTCRTAHETGVSIRKLDAAIAEEAGTDAPQEQPTQSAPLSAADPTEIARSARAAKHQAQAEFEAMQADTAKRLAEALEYGNAHVWRMLADKVAGWQSREALGPAFDYRLIVADALVGGLYYGGGSPNLTVALQKFNSELKAAGLAELDSHLSEPEPRQFAPAQAKPAVPPQNGKTLAEVFHDGDPANLVPGKQADETLVEYFFRTGQSSKDCDSCRAPMEYDAHARGMRCPKCGVVSYFATVDAD